MRKRVYLFISLLIFMVVIVAGAFLYHVVEGWSILDSFYFVIVTVTTIGYGDVVPMTSVGKVFTMFFSFFGVAMAFYFLTLAGSTLFKKHVAKGVRAIKEQVKRKKEVQDEIEDTLDKKLALKGKRSRNKGSRNKK